MLGPWNRTTHNLGNGSGDIQRREYAMQGHVPIAANEIWVRDNGVGYRFRGVASPSLSGTIPSGRRRFVQKL